MADARVIASPKAGVGPTTATAGSRTAIALVWPRWSPSPFELKPWSVVVAFLAIGPAAAATGCAAATGGTTAATAQATTDAAFIADAPLARYTSRRLELSIRLPDGRSWLIDDHTRPELVARHPGTHSTLRVAVLRADENVGHDRCEQLARERALVPEGPEQIVEDQITMTEGDFDTRIRVGLQPGGASDRPLLGHVVAIGGHLRKCFVFAFSTQVESASDEPILSSRLAMVRTRVLAGLELEHLGSLPRSSPSPAAASRPSPEPEARPR